jgi:gliding-associated putative ABC transporter substrate-binding component GldG
MVGQDNKKPANWKSKSSQTLWFVGGILVILFANVIGGRFFTRIDLTQDKRFTIASSTKEMLESLKEPIYVEVYLEGDFPAGFKRLQSSIKETLEEFRAYSGTNIQYKFTNPSISDDKKVRNQTYAQLAKKGLQPTNLNTQNGDNRQEKIIFPGAIIRCGSVEVPVQLLKGNQAAPPEVRLNQSVEGVEYELATAIKKLTQKNTKKIGILTGHKELNQALFYDMGITLKENYAIEPVRLQDRASLVGYDAIICAKPDSAFDEKDKYKIDQYIVKGGNFLIFIDPLKAEIDSIQANKSRNIDEYLALPNELNLTDLFFQWGVRINNDVVLDINSAAIPMVMGYVGNNPNTQLVPWPYYPLINIFGNHPVVKNMDAIYTRFPATIDTVKSNGIRKYPLLMSSKYSRIIPGPVRLSFAEIRNQPNPKTYNKSYLPIAYLLEGNFTSSFQYKINDEAKARTSFKLNDRSGKVLVVADGDFVRNEYNARTQQTYPLGYDRFAGVQFANKDFVMNCLNYMLDAKGVILAKSKDIKLRPLDKPRIAKERSKWQVLNIAGPLVLVALFGYIRFWLRKRKFAH